MIPKEVCSHVIMVAPLYPFQKKDIRMMKRRLLLSFALLLTVLAIQAVPAKPVKKTVQLQDGTVVELTLRGDEHFSYMTDATGVPYLMRANGKVERTTASYIEEKWTEQREKRLEKMHVTGSSSRASRRVGTSGTTTGKHRGLVILMQFTDVPFVTENPQATFDRFFNEIGYHDNGMTGSVKDYFLAQSYDQLEIDFDVVGPFTTANEMAYYGKPDGESNDIHPALMVAEAVDAAANVVDYSNYDWDGDGVVDQVFVIYAGYGQAQGADENTIWPHEYAISAETGSPKKYNGVTINTYGCASELRGNGKTNTGILDGIGTACHEFSHCLGLPDMYDTKGGNYAMAMWDVMCQGSYNGDSNTPSAYTSYERWFSGWMEPTEIKEMTRVTDMRPITEKGSKAYILYNEKNRNEYYLLENRQLTGFDAAQYGHGLLILHVDYNKDAWESNTVNITANRQRMTIIPADNNFQFTGAGLAGDPWPGRTGNTALTNYTTPAATLYSDNSDGTKFMSKAIDNITEDTENQTVSFVVCRPELATPSVEDMKEQEGENAFTVSWSAVSGAVGYELELTEIGSAASDPSEALQQEFDFSKCVSKTTGYSDISSKLSSYGLSGWKGSKLYTSPNKLKIGTSSSTGYVTTPTWEVPASQDITVVMGANVVTAGKAVKGTLEIAYGNNGESATRETVDFEVTGDGKQVFHFTVRKDLFYLTITPSAQMYLNYLAVYDGEWSADQLGISAAASRRASEVKTFTATTNSYTFTGLNTKNRYVYRVRSIGEENTYSNWSEERTFSFTSTGINMIRPASSDQTVRRYDLQGREVNGSTKGLVIRRQGNEVKKVIVK